MVVDKRPTIDTENQYQSIGESLGASKCMYIQSYRYWYPIGIQVLNACACMLCA